MKTAVIKRLLTPGERSFFLFGPRGTGKSTWLREVLPNACRLDLLDTALYYELQREPQRLEALVGRQPENAWVVLDEIQKVPALLDEVHRLMADRGWRFALCGSSARQLKKTGVNLLAGRALTLSMAPFSAAELGERFNLASALEYGLMPIVQLDRDYAAATLRAYVDTYIKEEIRQEGVVRNLPPFLRFLALAGQLNGEPVNGQNLARDAGIGRSTVDAYFTILTDTLLGSMLPAWQPRIKVRERTHPKFYWFDCGVARAAAGLLDDRPDRTWLGHALETYILHECRVRNVVSGQARGFYYYGLPAGGEIDLIIETRRPQPGHPARVIAVEIKMAEKWDRKWERAIRELAATHRVEVERMIGVYTGVRAYHMDGFDVLPVGTFIGDLHAGRLF